ncbi:unnamed protein product [Haemonchus placei]|uniref:MOSC domain-containing protein n=1 Tax=Haemonchus placei TaxID=6290 RepID=A0A0N4WUV8_HAEPC|nr:unnamed protein product [Haemonchus placei]
MDDAIVFFTRSKVADIVPLSDISGGHKINSTVKVRWNRKFYATKDCSSSSRCEQKITDLGEDGKSVERFFTVGESSTIPENDVFIERGDEIVARETSN